MELRATYTDAAGIEHVTLRNDGSELKMTVRGVEFVGTSFDGFEPAESSVPDALGFTFLHGDLCSFVLEFELTLPVVVGARESAGLLRSRLQLGDPGPRGSVTNETLQLELELGAKSYRSRGTSGWYEDELLDIQRSLPEGTFMKACITCAFSDYSPYGHGLFGDMMCFRDAKDAYRAVNSKGDLFAIWNQCSGDVQETHLCPEYERRQPNAGYRG